MTELKPIQGLFAVEVPATTISIAFRQSEFVNSTVSFYDQFTNKETLIELPGNCACLFQTKDVTEQQAAEVVERQRGGGHFKDYECVGSYAKYGTCLLWSALASLKGLLRANGLHPDKQNYLLIKKK